MIFVVLCQKYELIARLRQKSAKLFRGSGKKGTFWIRGHSIREREVSAVERELLLVVAVTLDVFLVACSYGVSGIRIGRGAAWIIAAVLGLAMAGSAAIRLAAPGVPWERIGAFVLIGAGICTLFPNTLKAALRWLGGGRKLSFSCFDIGFVLEVYLDETQADADASKVLSCREAWFLALAFSFDSLACGLGAGLSGASALRAAGMCLVCGLCAIEGGSRLGRRMVRRCRWDLSFLSGVVLVILGVLSLP